MGFLKKDQFENFCIVEECGVQCTLKYLDYYYINKDSNLRHGFFTEFMNFLCHKYQAVFSMRKVSLFAKSSQRHGGFDFWPDDSRLHGTTVEVANPLCTAMWWKVELCECAYVRVRACACVCVCVCVCARVLVFLLVWYFSIRCVQQSEVFRSVGLAEMYGGSSNMGAAYHNLPDFWHNRFWNNTYQVEATSCYHFPGGKLPGLLCVFCHICGRGFKFHF